METKKAIENIGDTYDCHSNDRACNNEERIKIEKEKNEVIGLLQRGEKYEKIFNEYKEYLDKLPTGCNSVKLYHLEQKHFPNY